MAGLRRPKKKASESTTNDGIVEAEKSEAGRAPVLEAKSQGFDKPISAHAREERTRQADANIKIASGQSLQSVLLSAVKPDPNNRRTWYLKKGCVHRLYELFQAERDKGELTEAMPEECFKSLMGTIESKLEEGRALPSDLEIANTVKGIWAFALHLLSEPLLQPFVVVTIGAGAYQTVVGNRRFIASYVAKGPNHSEDALVSKADPSHPANKRFIENNQREDTPLPVRIMDFESARQELLRSMVIDDKSKGAVEKLSARMGINVRTYYDLRIIAANGVVCELIEKGKVGTYSFAREVATLKSEKLKVLIEYLEKYGQTHSTISDMFEFIQASSIVEKPNKPPKKKGRPSKIKVPAIEKPKVIEYLLSDKVLAEKDWAKINFNDDSKQNIEKIQKLLENTIKRYVEKAKEVEADHV